MSVCVALDARLERLPENLLGRLANAGNEAAFEVLVRTSYDRCLRLAISILGDAEDARDELQNALWRAYTHLGNFDQRAKFNTWLARIVVNRCLTRLSRRKQWKTIPLDAAPESLMSLAVSRCGADRDTPEWAFRSIQLQDLVRREVRSMPLLLRQPLEFHYFEELPLVEVARRLAISLPAAKSRLKRAHDYLRDRMARHNSSATNHL